MAIFSIKDIEAVSGIKSHTLRIWEQRYSIIVPKRTKTNIRYYDDDDLKLIINISILNKKGIKISEIARLDKSTINSEILKLTKHAEPTEKEHVKRLVAAMLAYNEFEFHQLLSTHIIQFGLEATMLNIVFPFLAEVGMLWQIGSIQPSHEHFASNIIKQKLYVAIDGNVGRYHDKRKKFLLFLPEHEQHTIGLLFANFILRSRGHDVLYLGQQVPLVDLHDAYVKHKPDYILTQLTSSQATTNKQQFINEVAALWPKTDILLSGAQFAESNFVLPPNIKIINSLAHFITLVDELV